MRKLYDNEDERQEALDMQREADREYRSEQFIRPRRDGWAPADFVYEAPDRSRE